MMQASTTRTLIALSLLAGPLPLLAQDKPAEKIDASAEHHAAAGFDTRLTDCHQQSTRTQQSDCFYATGKTYTIQLQNISQQNDANEILVAVRNVFDPSLKIFLVSSQNALTLFTYPEEFARVDAFVKTLDRPRQVYRVTYTLTDMDGDRRISTQHFTLFAVDGQRTTLKQGSKIPVATGAVDQGKAAGVQTNFTYLDVGINLDNTLTTSASGTTHLKVKVEQSSVAADPAVIAGVSEPIIRQSVLENVVDIVPGRPVIVGSLDIAGSTHRLDIAVAVDHL